MWNRVCVFAISYARVFCFQESCFVSACLCAAWTRSCATVQPPCQPRQSQPELTGTGERASLAHLCHATPLLHTYEGGKEKYKHAEQPKERQAHACVSCSKSKTGNDLIFFIIIIRSMIRNLHGRSSNAVLCWTSNTIKEHIDQLSWLELCPHK